MPKEIVTKSKSGNSDSTNNSLAHPEETLDNETLQATTRQAIAEEDKRKRKPNRRVKSQVERILNICEIGHEIHISLNFSFKFGGIILILLNIRPV